MILYANCFLSIDFTKQAGEENTLTNWNKETGTVQILYILKNLEAAASLMHTVLTAL